MMMISEDHVTLKTNDAEHLAFITGINNILKYIKTENGHFTFNNVSKYLGFYCIFNKINGERKGIIKKKNLTVFKLLNFVLKLLFLE